MLHLLHCFWKAGETGRRTDSRLSQALTLALAGHCSLVFGWATHRGPAQHARGWESLTLSAEISSYLAAPHARQKFPCFKGTKQLLLCWGLDEGAARRASNRSRQAALSPRCFVSRLKSSVKRNPSVMFGLVGQELDAQDPLRTGDIQPVQILSPGRGRTVL